MSIQYIIDDAEPVALASLYKMIRSFINKEK